MDEYLKKYLSTNPKKKKTNKSKNKLMIVDDEPKVNKPILSKPNAKSVSVIKSKPQNWIDAKTGSIVTPKYGLSNNKELKEQELANKTIDSVRSEKLIPDKETIYRDEHGRKMNKEEHIKAEEEEEKSKKEDELKLKLFQRGITNETLEFRDGRGDLEKTTFARHRDDKALNKRLAEELHWEDPAASFLKKSKTVVVTKKLRGPPNRFNIAPGTRWDGVDRSNGYEKKLFAKINSAKNNLSEAYAWSTEDM